MLDDGEKLVPGFKQARALRVWTGVRPLFEDRKDGDAAPRATSRARTRCSTTASATASSGFLTITGGKLTTYRLMARTPSTRSAGSWARTGRARRTTEPLPGSESGEYLHINERLARREETLHDDQLDLRVRADPALAPRGQRARRGSFEPRRHAAAAAARAWARARAASASTARPGSCTASTASTAREATSVAAELPARALEGRVADPLRRPGAPGPPRRLDLPGRPRRGSPAVMRPS